MKRFFKMLLLVFFLSILYSYVLVISKIPEKIVVFEGETISMKTLFGIEIRDQQEETIETSASSGSSISDEVGKKTLEVSFLNQIPLGEIEVNVIPKTTVIPVGNIAGVKLYTSRSFGCWHVRN